MTSANARPRRQFVARILESIPAGQPAVRRPALILMAGLPGSGKSTFARRLAVETGATILESDAIRRMLFENPTHDTNESRALFAAIFDAAGRLLRDGRSIIVDATNLRPADRRPAHEMVAETGATLVIVYTTAPESVILERLSRREALADDEDHSLAGVAVYRHMAEEAQPIIEPHWEINTSDERATDAALTGLIAKLRLMGATSPAVAHVTGGSIS
jgi:predicted kinase